MMKTQTVPKGRHSTSFWNRFFFPARTRLNQRREITLYGPGLVYNIGPDQSDWNKLSGGMYFDLYQPHGRTIMIGWRYNPDTHAIELTPYYHNITNTKDYKAVGSVPGYVNEDNILSIPLRVRSIKIIVTIQVLSDTEVSIIVEDTGSAGYISDNVTFDKVGRYHTISNLYVGGNIPAQEYIHANVRN